MNEPVYCSTFDDEGDCFDCGKPRYKGGPCRAHTPTQKETSMTTQRKRENVIEEFEELRPRHNGVIVDAAPMMGMTPNALERALYRARKNGYEGKFKCQSKPAKRLTVVYAPEHETAQL